PVLRHRGVALDADVADLAPRHRTALVVHDGELVPRHRHAGRARARVAGPVRDEDVADLRGPDTVDDLDAEALAPAVVELLRQRLARRDAQAKRGGVEPLLRVLHREHRGEESRTAEEERRAIARDGLDDAFALRSS